MRILHTEWSNGWGGQEIRIINEIVALKKQGHEIFLACRRDSKIAEVALKSQIPIFYLPFRGNVDLYSLFRLFLIVRRKNIDIVNTHSGKDTWVGGLAAKAAGVKFIRTRHLSNLISTSKLNFINEVADFVITTGESVRSLMIKRNRIVPSKILSIPSGPDEKKFSPDKFSKNEAKKYFNLSKDEICIGMLAVMRRFKRYDKFVNMADYITTVFPDKNIKFCLAGDGPQRELIKNLIKDKNLSKNFIFFGHIDNTPEYLRALDLFVLCSDSGEGVPQSLMQSLMMNTASISTDVGSVRDLHFGNNFTLVDKDNQNELNHAVKKYIDNYDIAIGPETREFMVDNFSERVMIKKIQDLYKSLHANFQ